MNMGKALVLSALTVSLAACSSADTKKPRYDYQSPDSKVVRLDVPPDLTDPNQGDRYYLPSGGGAVRASDLNTAKPNVSANQAVLANVDNVHLERDGSIRWLSIADKQPAEIWPLLKAFWQEQGFTIDREEPSIGLMETDWAENRAKLPTDMVRSLFDKVGLGGIYSTGERDKFIIRLEHNGKNGADVFFTQKGLIQAFDSKQQDSLQWKPRPNDPNLEAVFLARFMQYLGADEQQIRKEVNKEQTQGTSLAKLEDGSILLSGQQERNWRRVALALDRVGLDVIGENTDRHVFLVQVAPAEGSAVANQEPGFFSRMFGSDKDSQAPKIPEKLTVLVMPAADGTRVSLADINGSAYDKADAQTWLKKLYQELR
ncbi:outer membrane protein assembly factor BamC [Stenoxybacter acetivorans]|uniref:outer membrane protein assembly factor BamC n=1 Tax=Stenoxybacter acetivorans TaxID=422441 RepID=UPI000567EAC3|nr:outer membrane protein assembly factor BamC [Stenoxybacter acetivorans]